MIIEQTQLLNFSSSETKKMIVCSGCFDLIHVGHILMLETLKQYAPILVVSVANDAWIKKTKGVHRPIIPERERLKMLDAIKYVDYVFLQEKGDISSLRKEYDIKEQDTLVWENCIYPISLLKPKICAVSSEFVVTPSIELFCKKQNIQLINVPYYEGQSTSKIIDKIQNKNL